MGTANNILSLVSIAGVINGRTKFQKMVYILKCKGVYFPEKFKYHHYGPFSLDLQLEIDELVFNGLLSENGSLEPNPTYSYSISTKDQNNGEFLKYAELITVLNSASIKVLELTSTIFFLKNQEKITEKSIIIEKLKFLKPHLESYIDKAFDLETKIDSFNF